LTAWKNFSLWIFLLGLAVTGEAQGFIFRHLTAQSGLVSNRVKSIFQDHEGYVWIGTMDGLQRYDGYRYVTYRTDLHDPNGLHADWISSIFEDSRGRLWFGCDRGNLYQFNRQNGHFKDYRTKGSSPDDWIRGVYKVTEDANKDIWISCDGGFRRLNPANNRFENYNNRIGLEKGELPINLIRDSQGNLWFTTTRGVHYYRCAERMFYDSAHPYQNDPVFSVRGNISGLVFDQAGNAWISRQVMLTNGEMGNSILFKVNRKTGTIRQYTFKKIARLGSLVNGDHEQTDNIIEDRQGRIFVFLAYTGVAMYNSATDDSSVTTINNESPHGLHSNDENFWGIVPLVDREGNIWIGTDKGINIFNPSKQYFHYYGFANDYHSQSAFPAYPVSSFLQTAGDGDVYLSYYGAAGGILRLDSDLNFKRRFLLPEGNLPKGFNTVWTLYQDTTGSIWGPNQAKSILKLNPVTEKLTVFTDSTLFGNINCIKRDSTGDLWIGHWSKGLIRVDHRTGKPVAFNRPPGGLTHPIKNVYCLYIDPSGVCWAGTNLQGLLRFDRVTNRFTDAFLFQEGDTTSISSNSITDIVPYNADTLLIGTLLGVNIFDKKSHRFTSITTRDGLPANIIQSLMLDDRGYCWASGLKGFCRIDIRRKKLVSFDATEGITDEEFTSPPLRLRNGNYVIGQGNGFVQFNPDSILAKEPPPDVTITGCRIAATAVPVDSLVNSNLPLKLSYKDNNLAIDFSALQFFGSANIRYYYQLEGVDKDWVLAGREQTANYSQLQGGRYNFRVRCVNREGTPSDGITTLAIVVDPPFWATWWFIALVFLSMAVLVFRVTKWFGDRKKEKQVLRLNYEKKLAVVEMNALRAQMNPHFIFNSLSSINNFILKNDPENATDYLIKFSQLMRLILDNSRTEWVLLQNELKALRLYMELEALRLDHSFTYFINAGPGVTDAGAIVPPLIIQPYVENAIWHGLLNRKQPGGRITVDIAREGAELRIVIEDNGIGREEAGRLKKKTNRNHKSHGMDITAERLAMVNEVYHVDAAVTIYDLQADDGASEGTRVLLTMHYKTNSDIPY